MIARSPAGNRVAVSESHTAATDCFSPRRQFVLRASRNSKPSEWNPAARSMVRANFKKPGQLDVTPISAPGGAGNQFVSDAGTDRTDKVTSSVPAGKTC